MAKLNRVVDPTITYVYTSFSAHCAFYDHESYHLNYRSDRTVYQILLILCNIGDGKIDKNEKRELPKYQAQSDQQATNKTSIL